MRRLLLGDWNRVVRDPLDLLRLSFLVGLVVFAAQGEAKGTFNMVLGLVVVGLARLVDLPRLFDLALILAMVLTMWGEALGLYDEWASYDRYVHTLVPLMTSQVLYVGLARLEVLPDLKEDLLPNHLWGVFVVTAALGIAVGGVWEVFEYASDGIFGSQLSLGNADTVGDLIADSAGSFVGAGLLTAYARWGWGSVKRIPGENRFEETSA